MPGTRRRARDAAFRDALEKQYGVPAGVVIAIHGMESGFDQFFGKDPVISSGATTAHDCRRSAFFSRHFLAALEFVDRGWLDPNAIGAAHGRSAMRNSWQAMCWNMAATEMATAVSISMSPTMR
ncbi:lytic murein transglycosylase [Pseudooceanicola antarcticus]|uniref:lytic murein transglycosylase n=1 Tax=Pseudooceanicola antarcticus TaxID=1247613 RepID=UPI002FCCEB97